MRDTEALRDTIAAAFGRWELVADGPAHEGPNGIVLPVRRGAARLILKVASAHGDEAHAGVALRHFAGLGCVRLVAAAADATLLERAQPGAALSALVYGGRDDEATAVLCAVASSLHAASSGALPRVFPTVEHWGRGFARHRASGRGGIPPALLDRGEALFAELCATQAARRLLHGDLHHDNVLWDDARGWLAIDPKGVIGEPAYEMGALLRNPGRDPSRVATPAVVGRRTEVMAESLGVEQTRLVRWGLAQAVLSAIWSIEDGEDAAWALAVAAAMA